MFKLLFGITVGAILMYLLDPSQGRERREMLSQRVNKSVRNLPEAGEQTAATVADARERAQSVATHTRDRFGETIEEARNEASGLARGTQERVESVANNQTDGTPNA